MMDQTELLALVAEGKDAWNEWADAHPDTEVNFSGVKFDSDVSFEGFHFPTTAHFIGATFKNAVFIGATFKNAVFGSATFKDAAFIGATFKDAAFIGATFKDAADFSGATFKDAVFSGATFKDAVDFIGATFSGDASFADATFKDTADFDNATFSGDAYFAGATFKDTAYFFEATFFGNTFFNSIDVRGSVNFEDAEFHIIPDFHAAKNPERIALDTVEFALPKPSGLISKCVYWATGLRGSDPSTMIRIRQIRGIANKNHAIDAERDLTILERNAEVGVAWSGLKEFRPFRQWVYSALTTLFSTPLLVLYRWTSDYGRSIKRPLSWLVTTPFIWFVVHFKLYLLCGIPGRYLLSDEEFSAIKSITLFGAFPISATQRPAYTAAVEKLSGGSTSADLPFALQISLTLQSVTSLIFLFLIGLALRNFFRMK